MSPKELWAKADVRWKAGFVTAIVLVALSGGNGAVSLGKVLFAFPSADQQVISYIESNLVTRAELNFSMTHTPWAVERGGVVYAISNLTLEVQRMRAALDQYAQSMTMQCASFDKRLDSLEINSAVHTERLNRRTGNDNL